MARLGRGPKVCRAEHEPERYLALIHDVAHFSELQPRAMGGPGNARLVRHPRRRNRYCATGARPGPQLLAGPGRHIRYGLRTKD